MPYQAVWDGEARAVVDVISVVDPAMASDPIMRGTKAVRPFLRGKQYVFRVRDGIRVTFNFWLEPPRDAVVIARIIVVR